MNYFITVFIILLSITVPATSYAGQKRVEVYCIRVIDGDTVEVLIGKKKERVRLLGVDTPEVKSRYTKEEYYGKEASAFTKKMVAGQTVFLEMDREKRDTYNRMLAYLYLSEGTLFNKILIEKGYAKVYRFFSYRKKKEFLEAEKKAKKRCVGMWKRWCKEKRRH